MIEKNFVPMREGNERIHLHTLLFVLYFLFAPMEDILTSSIGTLGKFLAIAIIATGISELRGKLRLKLDVKNTCMLLLMLLTLLSLLWSIDVESTIGRFQPYLLLPSLCIFTSMLDFSERDYAWITTASIIGGLLTAIYLLKTGNTITAYNRATLNDVNDPNNLAAQLLLPATLVWGGIMRTKGWRRILFAISFTFLSLSVLMTGSRGGLLSLLAMVHVYLFFAGVFKRTYVFFLTFLMVFCIVHFLPDFLPETLRRRMFSIDSYTSGGAGRQSLWEIAVFDIVPKIGLFGFGAGTSGIKMQEHIGYIKGIHNTYLTLIVEYGLLGLPIFLTMLISFFRSKINQRYIIGTSLLVGICVVIFFLDSYAKKFFWNVILLLVIHEQMADHIEYKMI